MRVSSFMISLSGLFWRTSAECAGTTLAANVPPLPPPTSPSRMRLCPPTLHIAPNPDHDPDALAPCYTASPPIAPTLPSNFPTTAKSSNPLLSGRDRPYLPYYRNFIARPFVRQAFPCRRKVALPPPSFCAWRRERRGWPGAESCALGTRAGRTPMPKRVGTSRSSCGRTRSGWPGR